MVRIGIIGSEGRMGQALARAIADAGHESTGGIDRGGDAAGLADRSEALVDFPPPPRSKPISTPRSARASRS